MKIAHEILPNGYLRLTCSPAVQAELCDLRRDDGAWGTDNMECEVLEHLLANSELEWIPNGACPGDLTSAPMLGIVRTLHVSDPPVHCFGRVERSNDSYGAVIARWAFMSYALRSFLDDLADDGECTWEGGRAEPCK